MPESTAAPQTIGRYAFYGEIASGGMATVHFARLVGPGNFSRIVAAKRLLPQLVSDPLFTAMLMDEARIAARIRHPNVVPTLDVVATGRELVIVMEYVHGESLSRLMRTAADLGDGVPAPIATTIIVEALHGLHAAHCAVDESGNSLGLVHRDVSPQNLLIGTDGITRVVDFGVAFASGRSHETRNGAVKGKLSYMAPEQIEREPLTPATDVFAISVVLWELLTGQRLFVGQTDGEIVHRILSGTVPKPSSVAADLAPAYDRILERGLARNPSDRYASAQAMATELEQATPLVRPSEIGAWVQRTASDTLTRRSRSIAKIESAPAEAPSEPEVPATRPLTLKHPDALGTGAQVSWVRSETNRKPAGKQLLAVVALLALGAAGMHWLSPRIGEAPQTMPRRSGSVVATPTTPAPPRITALSADPSPAAVASASVAAATEAALTPGVGARPKRAAPSARARPRPPVDCDPPYSVDASGRRLFKLECM